MMRILLLLFSVLLCMNLQAQTNSVWLRANDINDPELVGYVDQHQNVKIPVGKYSMCFTDTFKTYAIVLKPGEGFIGINKKEETLFRVFPYDNGPDYIKDGMFRIVEDSKMGFADSTGTVIIKPQYDFVFSFDQGFALVNKGGKKVTVNPEDVKCQHWFWKGGKWGVIDKEGHLVLPVKYDYVRDVSTRTIYLEKGKRKYQLLDGELVRSE